MRDTFQVLADSGIIDRENWYSLSENEIVAVVEHFRDQNHHAWILRKEEDPEIAD